MKISLGRLGGWCFWLALTPWILGGGAPLPASAENHLSSQGIFPLQKNAPGIKEAGLAWTGDLLLNGESTQGWGIEADSGSTGTMSLIDGVAGQACRLSWNLGTGDWVQARYDFALPLNLSQADLFGISLRGSAGVQNRVSLMFADENGVFFGLDWDGINTVTRWMKNLVAPKQLFRYFFTIGPDPNRREMDWSKVNRFFLVVKRPGPQDPLGSGGGSGTMDIDNLQSGRTEEWLLPDCFTTTGSNPAAAAAAAAYAMNSQRSSGLFCSWEEEPSPKKAWLYDQALVLILLCREGVWSGGLPANPAAVQAKKLADFLVDAQKTDGHWAQGWNPDTAEELVDDGWVGDQAWAVLGLSAYAEASGDEAMRQSCQRAADWLVTRVDDQGKVLTGTDTSGNRAYSTEAAVDTWWAMLATGRLEIADRIQHHLLSTVWDRDLGYWWRGYLVLANGEELPDPVVALDCNTWGSMFARHARVKRPDCGRAALAFVRQTLVTTDDSGFRQGFDGQGPVSIWCEGTAQYVSAGGPDAAGFLSMLCALQRPGGGMPGSPDSWETRTFGWLTKWTGLAPTCWLYFALTKSPFPIWQGFDQDGDINGNSVLEACDLVILLHVLAGNICPYQEPAVAPLRADFDRVGILKTSDGQQLAQRLVE